MKRTDFLDEIDEPVVKKPSRPEPPEGIYFEPDLARGLDAAARIVARREQLYNMSVNPSGVTISGGGGAGSSTSVGGGSDMADYVSGTYTSIAEVAVGEILDGEFIIRDTHHDPQTDTLVVLAYSTLSDTTYRLQVPRLMAQSSNSLRNNIINTLRQHVPRTTPPVVADRPRPAAGTLDESMEEMNREMRNMQNEMRRAQAEMERANREMMNQSRSYFRAGINKQSTEASTSTTSTTSQKPAEPRRPTPFENLVKEIRSDGKEMYSKFIGWLKK